MYDKHASTPGNTAKLGTAQQQHTDSTKLIVRLWLGANLQCISQHTTESAH